MIHELKEVHSIIASLAGAVEGEETGHINETETETETVTATPLLEGHANEPAISEGAATASTSVSSPRAGRSIDGSGFSTELGPLVSALVEELQALRESLDKYHRHMQNPIQRLKEHFHATRFGSRVARALSTLQRYRERLTLLFQAEMLQRQLQSQRAMDSQTAALQESIEQNRVQLEENLSELLKSIRVSAATAAAAGAPGGASGDSDQSDLISLTSLAGNQSVVEARLAFSDDTKLQDSDLVAAEVQSPSQSETVTEPAEESDSEEEKDIAQHLQAEREFLTMLLQSKLNSNPNIESKLRELMDSYEGVKVKVNDQSSSIQLRKKLVEEKAGIEDGRIPLDRISVSAAPNPAFDRRGCRLNGPIINNVDCWMAPNSAEPWLAGTPGPTSVRTIKFEDAPWIEVTFDSPRIVNAVFLQGRIEHGHKQYVSAFQIAFESPCAARQDRSASSSQDIMHVSNLIVDSVNIYRISKADAESQSSNSGTVGFCRVELKEPVECVRFRLLIREFVGYSAALRWELGVLEPSKPPLIRPGERAAGLSDFSITDPQITVASALDANHDARGCRLNYRPSNRAACWTGANLKQGFDWIRVDFWRQETVTAVLIQGRALDVYGEAAVEQYIRSFRLTYRDDFTGQLVAIPEEFRGATWETKRFELPRPVLTSQLTLTVTEYPRFPSLRWEIVVQDEKDDTNQSQVEMVKIYEYQRKYPFKGWTMNLLPTDPSNDSFRAMQNNASSVDAGPGFYWRGSWMQRPLDSDVDSAGWEYAVEDRSSYHKHESMLYCFRRRTWLRAKCRARQMK